MAVSGQRWLERAPHVICKVDYGAASALHVPFVHSCFLPCGAPDSAHHTEAKAMIDDRVHYARTLHSTTQHKNERGVLSGLKDH